MPITPPGNPRSCVHRGLALLALLCVAACQPASQVSSKPLHVWVETAELKAIAPLINVYARERGAKITYSSYPASRELRETAKQQPDVLLVSEEHLAEWIGHKRLVPLDPLLSERDRIDFPTAVLGAASQGGKVWGLPQRMEGLVLYHSASEPAPETFEGAKQINLYGDLYYLLPLFWSLEAPLGFDLRSVKALDEQTRRLEPNRLPIRQRNYLWGQRQFRRGKVAMRLDGTWAAGNLLRENLAVSPVPGGRGGRGTPVQVLVLAMTQTAPLSDAWKLVSYLNRAESQGWLADKFRWLPARLSAYDLPVVRGDRTLLALRDALKPMRILSAAERTQLEKLKPAWKRIWQGEATVDEALLDVFNVEPKTTASSRPTPLPTR